MLFFVGLERLTQEEKVDLLAQTRALSGQLIISDRVSKGLKKAKDYVGQHAERLAHKMSFRAGSRVHDWNERLDWNAERFAKRVAEEQEHLRMLSPEELQEEMLACLRKLARLDKQHDEHDVSAVACAVIHEAASSLAMDARVYLDAASLEGAVFEKALKEMVDALQKKLASMSEEEQGELEDLLRQELERLTEGDREAIRQALGVSELSAKALLTFLRSGSALAVVQLLAGSFGFGAFLFLTTMLKAFSLLIGITLPFGVYTAGTSLLSFALSLPCFLLIMAVTGGWILNRTNGKLDQQLSKMLVVAGRASLMQEASEPV